MPQDDPAAGINNWEAKFWSAGGLLHKSPNGGSPGNVESNPNKDPDVAERQKSALASFQKKDDQEQPINADPRPSPAESKAAVSKMSPEHVHRLVQDAHSGKYGPDAQRIAQSAMQSQPPSQNNQPDFTVGNADQGNGSGGNGADDAASIFGSGR